MINLDQLLPISPNPLILLTPPPISPTSNSFDLQQHTFASFLSRDTTYDLIGNIWRMVHPVVPTSAGLPDHSPSGSEDEGGPSNGVGEDTGMTSGVEKDSRDGGREGKGVRKRLRGFRRPRGGTGESSNAGGSKVIAEASEPSNGGAGGGGGSGNNSARPGSPNGGGKRHAHPVTKDTCPTLKNLKEVCMDTIFPSAPEKIYNLMFTSGFMKDFWTENQKLLGQPHVLLTAHVPGLLTLEKSLNRLANWRLGASIDWFESTRSLFLLHQTSQRLDRSETD